ncbi:MAG: hypothetical protein HKN35_04625 [Woeseia sp.]|nr:hypothetical protein [Woeseia sp.]NNE60155.1 hypothetical protein [Woeseia sp.]
MTVRNSNIFFMALLLIGLVLMSGCTVSEIVEAEHTELAVAKSEIEENLLLDVGIINFDPGISEKNNAEKTGVFEEIRQAEARYLPYHIKTTLQGTGFWGAVRVIPSRYVFTDVTLTGEIEKSDGEYVELKVVAEDATGRQWFENRYEMQTGLRSYDSSRDRTQDPYQKVFNDIANDLRQYVATLSPGDIKRIREVSEMRFFADMAPAVFSDYVATDDDNMTSLVRLPAENDPMVDRLRQIRERDRLVIDTLNEHYANFYYGVALPYEGWRKKARENSVNIRQVKRSATMRALLGVVVVAGSLKMDTDSSSRSRRNAKRVTQSVGIDRGIQTIISAWRLRQSADMYREDIRELSESFIAEAAPLTVQVQGQTRRLTGTAEAQYEGWRKLLKDIYELETGVPSDVDVGVPARSAISSE